MTHLAGDWVLEERIGRGRQADVWRAKHRFQTLSAAVKVDHRPAAGQMQDALSRIARLARLQHPHIAKTYDTGVVSLDGPERIFVAFELLDGGTLAERQDLLDWESVHTTIEHVLVALQWAHSAGVLHRDVKPENIMFRGQVGWDAVLNDFGMAWQRRQLPDQEGPGGGATVAFAAPEQNSGSVTAQVSGTDLYALAATVWWCVTGRGPFGEGDARAVAFAHRHSPLPSFEPRFNVPQGLEKWLRRLLTKNPAKRGATYRALDDWRVLGGAAPSPRSWRAWWPGVQRAVSPGLLGVGPPPFVARSRAMDTLESLLGSRTRVGLIGAEGSGRHALATHFGRYVFATGQALPVGLPSGDQPFSRVLRYWLRIDLAAEDPRLALKQRLQTAGLTDGIDLALYTEAAEALHAGRPVKNARGLLRRFCTALADGLPLVLMLDDQPDVCAFADSLLEQGEATLALRVSDTRRDDHRIIGMKPLAKAERELLVHTMAPLRRDLMDDLLQTLPAWPGPIVSELIALAPRLEWVGDRLGLRDAKPARRFDDRERIGIGLAVAMKPFEHRTWLAAMKGLGVSEPDALFQWMTKQRIMTFGVKGLKVRRSTTLEDVLHRASAEERTEWYRALATASQPGTVVAGRYHALAGDRERAAQAWLPPLFSRLAPATLIERARLAATVLDDDDVRMGQCIFVTAIAHATSGEVQSFQREADALAAWVERSGHRQWDTYSAYLRGWSALYGGEPKEAVLGFEEARDLCTDPKMRSEIERGLGEANIQAGRLDEAITHFQRSVDTADRPNLSAIDLAWALGAAGEHAQGLVVLARYWDAFEPSQRSAAHQTRGDLLRWAGSYDDAEEDYDAAVKWASRFGMARHAHEINAALLEWERGQTDAALARLHSLLHGEAAWILGTVRALAIRIGVSGRPIHLEAALAGLEQDGLSWEPDAIRLLEEAIELAQPDTAARIRAVLQSAG